jgi:hypothetical protein
VGQEEEAFAEMGGAHAGRAEHSPLRIEPHVGQGPQNRVESSSNKRYDVFEKDPLGSYLAKDAVDVRPEPAVVVQPALLPGVGPRLAREAGSDEIHAAAPRAAVEGGEVRPDRSVLQGLVRHPRHEDGRSEGFPLDETHAAEAGDDEPEPELQPADPGAEGEPGKPGTWYQVMQRAPSLGSARAF